MTHPIAGAHPPPGRPREEALLDGLTPEQAQAVQHGPGPLLLIAGPGAGKTKTLIHRIARLLADRRGAAVGDPRGHVLGARGRRAATAARRSARRAGRARRHRGHVSLHLRADAQRARRRVRPHRELHRLRPGRRAPRDRMAALRSAARADPTGARRLRAAGRQPRCSPRSRWPRTGCCPPTATSRHARHAAAPLIAAVWREAEIELQRSNALDFDDLLTHAVRLLAEHPHRLAFYRQRWQWLLVDEYQDTNEAQSVLVALLAGAGGNVCCVADDDQLIYSWRGAEPRNILAFGERFPAHARIVLGRNFRCRSEILDAAVACVAHNAQREAKALIAMRGGGGEVRVIAYGSDRHEADTVAAAIGQALARGIPAGEVLVLARTGYATGPLQAALARAGIPHRVLGSLGLYERSEVRDALAYLALLANPADAQAFRRAVGSPRRGVGTATANRVDPGRPRNPPRRPDHGQRARERDREHPTARRARAAHAVRRRTRPRPSRAARRTLDRARRRHRGDARRRTRRAPPAPARQLAETRGAPGRRTGARGPALPVPRRPGLRGAAHRQRHA